jgi:hypothetical protein
VALGEACNKPQGLTLRQAIHRCSGEDRCHNSKAPENLLLSSKVMHSFPPHQLPCSPQPQVRRHKFTASARLRCQSSLPGAERMPGPHSAQHDQAHQDAAAVAGGLTSAASYNLSSTTLNRGGAPAQSRTQNTQHIHAVHIHAHLQMTPPHKPRALSLSARHTA